MGAAADAHAGSVTGRTRRRGAEELRCACVTAGRLGLGEGGVRGGVGWARTLDTEVTTSSRLTIGAAAVTQPIEALTQSLSSSGSAETRVSVGE